MLFLSVFVCVCMIGYLAQTTGLCMVRGVREWHSGNKEFLLAILFSGVFVWVAGVFSYITGLPLHFNVFALSGWVLAGGFIFGLGSAMNQACGISTLERLTRGDFRMLMTIIGWFIGWTLLASWSPKHVLLQGSFSEEVHYTILFIVSLMIVTWTVFGDNKRKTLWLGMMGIGLMAGFVYLYLPKWPPSALLHQLTQALTHDNHTVNFPTAEQYIVFFALLLGMFLAALRTKRYIFMLPNIKQCVVHITAGIFMGVGASLAMGGNSVHLLMGLPYFSPAGFGAVIGILLGIWSGFYLIKRFRVLG